MVFVIQNMIVVIKKMMLIEVYSRGRTLQKLDCIFIQTIWLKGLAKLTPTVLPWQHAHVCPVILVFRYFGFCYNEQRAV